ncbi:MAG TPA: hypothetical protein VJZ71_07855 [Phycisphaerae bacterium]|nr:hypothetical protein [Phycisphaerae bacterium]
MLNWPQYRTLARISLAILCVPICVAATCPGTTPTPPGNTILLDEAIATSAGTAIPADVACPPPEGGARGLATVFNAVEGKLVTITVEGPTANSRPQIRVQHILNFELANSGTTPTTQINTITFTPLASTIFGLTVNECANVTIGSFYAVQVSQAP